MINLFFLKTFVDVAKTGSFRSAAFKNFVTQPAVTQHIRILEKKLGCKLFERQNKKVVLTPCGNAFRVHAESILKQYEEAKIQLAEIDKQFFGTIRIATIYSIGLYELKPIVRNYLRRFPKVDIQLEYHPFNKIYEMVSSRTIDFGFVAFPQKKQGIILEEFDREELVLVQAVHHPIFRKKEISLKDLDKARFVAFSINSPTRRAIDNFLHDKKIYPNVVNEYDNIETLKSAIELGIGCSLIPKNTVSQETKNRSLEIVHTKGLTLTRPLGIIYPKGKVFATTTRAFYNTVVDSATYEI